MLTNSITRSLCFPFTHSLPHNFCYFNFYVVCCSSCAGGVYVAVLVQVEWYVALLVQVEWYVAVLVELEWYSAVIKDQEKDSAVFANLE